MSDETDRKPQRRDFLNGLAAGTLAAAAALAVPRKALAIPESKAVREKTRYQLSEHVKRFYETNRY